MRTLKAIVAAILAALIVTASGCGTLGGGGMRYLVDPPIAVSTSSGVFGSRAAPRGGGSSRVGLLFVASGLQPLNKHPDI